MRALCLSSRALVAFVLLSTASNSLFAATSTTLDLSGSWRFALDRSDLGVSELWWQRQLPETVRLPGVLAAQGIGDRPSLATPWIGTFQDRQWTNHPTYAPHLQADHFRFPFWLQPERHYVGRAWFQREVEIPEGWREQRIQLSLERPHWETRVWVDDQTFGSQNTLGTPHEYELGSLTPGRHTLTIAVDNRLVVDVGVDSHSMSDHTQGNWNGIVGRLALQATPTVWIEDLQLYPDVARRAVVARGRLGNLRGHPGRGSIRVVTQPVTGSAAARTEQVGEVSWEASGGAFELRCPLSPAAPLWDEFDPQLHEVTARLEPTGHTVSVRFGLREFAAQGTQFALNGRKVFLRGTLECAIFPRTGHPPTAVADWKRVLNAARAHGLNHLRFHSWCPPAAAFAAADELGMFLQIECSSWANASTTLGDGKPVDAWVLQEATAILRHYGNHPSFVLLAYGNEPGGPNQKRYLANWVNHFKATDPRRLYTSASGWPQIPENQFHVAPEPRIQAWGDELKSRINAQPPETRTDYRKYIAERTVPVISHEIGQWCVYPNFDEIPKYTGYLKPKNFEIFRDTLQAHGMSDQARAFLHASGRLQTLCYKEDIESALRTPGMAGFQLLDLHDFPGQGTALVGVLDPFWEPKGYVTAAEFRRFCQPTVPLARLARRVFTEDDALEADLEIAHFGPRPLAAPRVTWRLLDRRGATVRSGHLTPSEIPVGNGIPLARITAALAGLPVPAQYSLVVGVEPSGAENDWQLWVYPRAVDTIVPSGILAVSEWDDRARQALERGERVWINLPPSRLRGDRLGPVPLGFSSIFWNTAWTHRQAPHTLGILCDPQHPLLRDFPTETHSDWQWWYVLRGAGAMILDDLPHDLRPSVQVIDDWVTNRRLGLAFEAKVGHGRVLVTSFDLANGMEADPVRRQFRHSLVQYLASSRFQPRTTLTFEQIRGLTKD